MTGSQDLLPAQATQLLVHVPHPTAIRRDRDSGRFARVLLASSFSSAGSCLECPLQEEIAKGPDWLGGMQDSQAPSNSLSYQRTRDRRLCAPLFLPWQRFLSRGAHRQK